MGDGGKDLRAVANDATLEPDERLDAAAPCPADPPVLTFPRDRGGISYKE